MLTNANKGTYLVKNWQKYANVIYERPLRLYNLRVAFVIYGKTFMNQPLTFSEPYKMSTDVIHCRDYNPIGCIIRDTVFEDESRPITK